MGNISSSSSIGCIHHPFVKKTHLLSLSPVCLHETFHNQHSHLSFLLLTRLSLYLCAFPSYRLFNLLSLSLPLTACGCASPFCLSVILIWKQQVQVFCHKVPLTLERAIGERGAINDRGPIEPINDLIQVWYVHLRYITSCISFSCLSHVSALQLWMSFTEIELRRWRWKIKFENIRYWGMEETVRPYHCNK